MANVIKGTITPSSLAVTRIQFGKKVSGYVWYLEMAEASKTALVTALGSNNWNQAYAFLGMYPKPIINGKQAVNAGFLYMRYNASTDAASESTTSAYAITDEYIEFYPNELSANSGSRMLIGYSYNWYVIPFEND